MGRRKQQDSYKGFKKRERNPRLEIDALSFDKFIKARGYCATLPEDQRVDTEHLLWTFCRYPRGKRAGIGFPPLVQAGSCSATPEWPTVPTHLLQVMDKLSCPYIQAPLDPQTCVGANQNDVTTHGGTEEHQKDRDLALLRFQACGSPCSVSFSPAVAVVCNNPHASRKSLGFTGAATLKPSIGVHGTRLSHPSRVCFQDSFPKGIVTPGMAPETSCHFTALQLLMFISVPSASLPEHRLPLAITVPACGFSIILMFWFLSDYVSVMV